MTSGLETVPAGGLVLGRYRPLRPLGTGGSGSVWLARDEESGLEVALKIVTKEGKAAPRAEREGQAAARLRHPHCLRAYGFAGDDRHVYIAYEYVPGQTLRHALRAGELDDAASLEAAAQVLDALAYAHGKGIVHRDVKPSNVLVAEGPEISVRLFDFGLAQLADAETLTAVGDVPGTLAYISPERLQGEAAGPAADVWAVGVLLWEALTGRHPFWQVSPLETGRQIQAGAPSLREVRPDLPRPLTTAVDRALSVEPGRRPSAAALAEALRGAHRERVKRVRGRPPLRFDPRPATCVGSSLLAALVAGWVAASLPFFPPHWPLLLAVLAAGLTAVRPRIGLAFTLAVPVFPLGNAALGLAVVYAAVAAAWLALAYRAPRTGVLFALGALLAPAGGLGLLPLLLQRVPGGLRRLGYAVAATIIGGVVAGIRGAGLPFSGDHAAGLGIAPEEGPLAVAGALWQTLGAHAALGREALVLGVAAAALPYALRGGELAIAGFGAALLAGSLVAAPEASVWPLALTAWATGAVLLLEWRLRGGGPTRWGTFGTIWLTMRATFLGRLRAGGGLGWPRPRRVGPLRAR